MTRRLAALALLALAGCTTAPEPAPAPTQTGPPGLRLHLGTSLPFVRARVGNLEPMWFLLDTGAGLNIVSTWLAERLGNLEWKEYDFTVTDPGKRDTIARRHTVLPSVALGKHIFRDVPVSAMDMSAIERVMGMSMGGVLGIPFMARRPITIDYPRGLLLLDPEPLTKGAEGVLPLRPHPSRNVPLVPVSVAGGQLSAVLDTGSAQGLGLPSSVLEKLRLLQPIVTVGKTMHIGGVIDARVCRIAGDLRLGAHTFSNPVVDVDEQWPRLGYDILRFFVVTIDAQRSLVRFERDSLEPIPMTGIKRHGVGFIQKGGDWIVGYVLENVPAARPARVGDRVVRITKPPGVELGPGWLNEVYGKPLSLELERDGERYTLDLPSVDLIR